MGASVFLNAHADIAFLCAPRFLRRSYTAYAPLHEPRKRPGTARRYGRDSG